MTIKQKIATSIATGAFLGAILTGSAFASDADLIISGNGNNSTNTINSVNINSSTVTQANNVEVTTEVLSVANSGGNTANSNTGGDESGDPSIDTGNATSKVNVSVSGGQNSADANPCGCPTDPLSAKISGNGNNSDNTINQVNTQSSSVTQANNLKVKTYIGSIANTGKNKANKNTGGEVSISTGNARSRVGVRVTGPSNTLNP